MSIKFKLSKRGHAARNALIRGADYLADCVKDTLGPFGSNWLLEKDGGRITNDGVTVAKELMLKDEFENQGLRALREAATKTNDQAGDGTTTATTLAQAILHRAVRFLGDEEKGVTAKKTGAEVIRQIEAERLEVEERLAKMTEPVSTKEDLVKSAIVSMEDEALGRMVAETQWDLGPEGIILAEETAERDTTIERVTGIRIDNGFGISNIVNNHEKEAMEVENAYVILTNQVLQDLRPVQKIIQQIERVATQRGENANLVLVARAFSDVATAICLKNIQHAKVKIYPVNAPYFDQKQVMTDMAAILGGTFYDVEESSTEDMQISEVGWASKVVAYRYSAVFTGKNDEAAKERIAARVAVLKEKMSGTPSDFEKKNLQQRIAQMENGFAILKVGATSEKERKYRFDKATDGVNAVRLALQEGVVPGAGLAFKQIADELPDTYILKDALYSLHDQILSTAPSGWKVPEWVKDPAKVLRVALKNACSVAGTLATAAGVTATERDPVRYVQEVGGQTEEEEVEHNYKLAHER